jgi:guanosine-3',5'-bis(diphosphate) 3'-pyrophosphohydrolase
MNYIPLLLTSFAVLHFGSAAAFEKQIEQEQVSMQEIESRLAVSRQFIDHLVHASSTVLNQFDAFAHILKQTYLAGEGLIDKDVYNIIDALVFAAEKHRFQVRKDLNQTPYIIHPIGVAYNLMSIGKVHDPDILIGALLHDTVEDTQTTFDEIEQRFGSRVRAFVQEVTDDKSLPKLMRKQFQVEHAPEKSAGAAQIKLADKLYNLEDLIKAGPIDWDEERVGSYFQWAKAVVDNLPWVNAPLKKAVDDVIEGYWQAKRGLL